MDEEQRRHLSGGIVVKNAKTGKCHRKYFDDKIDSKRKTSEKNRKEKREVFYYDTPESLEYQLKEQKKLLKALSKYRIIGKLEYEKDIPILILTIDNPEVEGSIWQPFGVEFRIKLSDLCKKARR